MGDLSEQVVPLSWQGLCCAQIVMKNASVILGEGNAPTSLCSEIVANTVSRCLTLLDGAT